MRIRLGLLDRWKPIGYETTVDVALVSKDSYKSIGTCKIIIDKDGSHYGQLNLSDPISDDLYLYYRIGESSGMNWLYGLDFMDYQHNDRQTIQIKDAIIQ